MPGPEPLSSPIDEHLSAQAPIAEEPQVYPVYIDRRTCFEIFRHCRQQARCQPPREALGVILGFRRSWLGTKYVRVTDWATGRVEASSAYARFTPEGILEYRLALHDRYGANPHTPRVVGLWHSHPFGGDPHFSSTDLRTFLETPFHAEGNVFFLVDPISHVFKVYMLRASGDGGALRLERVDWCTYRPAVPVGTTPPPDEVAEGENRRLNDA